MNKYAKAVTAFIASAVTVAATIGGAGVVAWATPELVAGVGTIVSTVLVYAIPNGS